MKKLFISPFKNPYINLSIEQNLLQNLSKNEEVLFLYENEASVIIGRFQNPWVETNPFFLEKHNIPLIRRYSGGGTVYHDLGNLNFSFIQNKTDFNKISNLTQIQNFLKELNFSTEISPRQDLIIKSSGNIYKISGSAYQVKQHYCCHHGTLLVNCDLSRLSKGLKAHNKILISDYKGTPSNRSNVINLSSINPKIKIRDLVDIVKKDPTFKYFKISEDHIIPDIVSELKSHKWLYDKTPNFKQIIKNEEISIKKGYFHNNKNQLINYYIFLKELLYYS